MAKYITKLSNDKIVQFLQENGFELITEKYDRNNNLIPPIQRSKDMILVRAKLNPKEEDRINLNTFSPFVKNIIFATALFSAFNDFDFNSHILVLKDYSLNLINTNESLEDFEIELFKSYIYFMRDEFGNEYVENYNNYVDQVKNEQLSNNQDEQQL